MFSYESKNWHNALYEIIVKPLVLHTAYKVKVPSIIIIIVYISSLFFSVHIISTLGLAITEFVEGTVRFSDQ